MCEPVSEDSAEGYIALSALQHRAIRHQARVAFRAGVKIDFDHSLLPNYVAVVRQDAVSVELDSGVLIPLRIPDIGERIIHSVEIVGSLEYQLAGFDPVFLGMQGGWIESGRRVLLKQPFPIAFRFVAGTVYRVGFQIWPYRNLVVILRTHMMNWNPRREGKLCLAHLLVVPDPGNLWLKRGLAERWQEG